MKNKKGISPVVATILILLIVIVAVGLMWRPIREMIVSTGEKTETNCILSDVEISQVSCLDNNLSVTIKNAGSQEINGIQAVAGANSEEEHIDLDVNEESELVFPVDEDTGTVNAASILGQEPEWQICPSSDSEYYSC